MEDSILNSVKDFLGVSDTDETFDKTLILTINSVLNIYHQVGGVSFIVLDENDKWSDFLQDTADQELMRTYTCMKVKMIFDSSTMSGTQVNVYNELINEYEWRIYHAVGGWRLTEE